MLRTRLNRLKTFLIVLCWIALGCGSAQCGQRFQTSFESVSDFNRFYIVPQNHMGTASHELSSEVVHSGQYAHKGWVYGINPPSTPTQNNNHRGYPTVQLYKTVGAFRTPVKITFYAYVEGSLSPGEWLSLATLDYTTSDIWDPVLINISDQSIAVKEVTAQVTSFTTFAGSIPLTSAETLLAAGNYSAEMESRDADGISSPVTELKFTLKIADQVIV